MVKTRKIPQRKCVGCQEMRNKRELLRVVRAQEGEVDLDLTGKKPGRGAYICPSVACLNQAVQGKRLEKALTCSIPQQTLETLKEKMVAEIERASQ